MEEQTKVFEIPLKKKYFKAAMHYPSILHQFKKDYEIGRMVINKEKGEDESEQFMNTHMKYLLLDFIIKCVNNNWEYQLGK